VNEFDLAWHVLKGLPKQQMPTETEGNYRGKEPATAEGRYGTKVTPEAIAREMEQIDREMEEDGIPPMRRRDPLEGDR
jgi:hypothetical protein